MKKIIIFLLPIAYCLLLINYCLLPNPIYAAETREGTASVNAHVADTVAPTAPQLIAPENGSFLSNPRPTFIFTKATDYSGIWYYQLFLNDILYLNEIPSSATPVETDLFLCVILNDTISVSLKQPLADGIFTWQIKAFDIFGNESESEIWTFTIDTMPPFIIVTQVEENTQLNLSSQDPDSIPAGFTLETTSNKPEFKGKSEPGAQIQITLIPTLNPNHQIVTFKGVVDTHGNFILVCPKALEREEKYLVSIVASDAASNTTVLPDFWLYIKRAQPSPLPILETPQALLQLPEPSQEINKLVKLTLYLALALTLLLPWLIKWLFSLAWPAFGKLLSLLFLPICCRKKKNCLVYNAVNNKGVVLGVLTSASWRTTPEVRFLTDFKGRFYVKLKNLTEGIYEMSLTSFGFEDKKIKFELKKNNNSYYLSKIEGQFEINIDNWLLSIPLNPDIKQYKKYKFVIKVIYLIVLMDLILALLSLLFWPNLISLILFIVVVNILINIYG